MITTFFLLAISLNIIFLFHLNLSQIHDYF